MKVEVGVLGFPILNNPYGMCDRKVTLEKKKKKNHSPFDAAIVQLSVISQTTVTRSVKSAGTHLIKTAVKSAGRYLTKTAVKSAGTHLTITTVKSAGTYLTKTTGKSAVRS